MRRVPLVCGIALVLSLPVSVRGESDVPPDARFKGLRSVFLAVENASGWSEVDQALAVIRPQIETKLRASGLELLFTDESLATPPGSTLRVIVRAAKSKGSLQRLELSEGPDPDLEGSPSAYVFLVEVRLDQQVQGTSNKQLFFTSTFSWNGWLLTEQKRPFKTLRGEIMRGISDFILSWCESQEAR
jgi:hypothetical protein